MSERIWNFFHLIQNSILTDQGIFDEFLEQIFAVIINLINKTKDNFKSFTFNVNG